MKKFAKTLLLCLPFLGTACSSSNDLTTTTVSQLDLKKYSGKWYEVARFNHRFERDMVGCTAQYSIKDDGTVKVVNAIFIKRSKYKRNVTAAPRAVEGYGNLFVITLHRIYRKKT